MQPELDAVIAETNANRERFAAFCCSLTPPQLSMVEPGGTWRAKDYIAHLASIDVYVREWFEHLAEGTQWRPRGEAGGPFDIDAWNQLRIEERQEASVDDLLSEAAGQRELLWAVVGRFSPELLSGLFQFRGREISYLRYLQLWAGHDPAHTADMLRSLRPEDRRPDIDAWLTRYRV